MRKVKSFNMHVSQPQKNLALGGVIMTVVENPGSLEIVFTLPDTSTRMESIRNIRPEASDQDLYDIGLAIANLLTDTLSDIRRVSTKVYAA